jgi:hypothetical protein
MFNTLKGGEKMMAFVPLALIAILAVALFLRARTYRGEYKLWLCVIAGAVLLFAVVGSAKVAEEKYGVKTGLFD